MRCLAHLRFSIIIRRPSGALAQGLSSERSLVLIPEPPGAASFGVQ